MTTTVIDNINIMFELCFLIVWNIFSFPRLIEYLTFSRELLRYLIQFLVFSRLNQFTDAACYRAIEAIILCVLLTKSSTRDAYYHICV